MAVSGCCVGESTECNMDFYESSPFDKLEPSKVAKPTSSLTEQEHYVSSYSCMIYLAPKAHRDVAHLASSANLLEQLNSQSE